jgi:hypothetical protein
VAWICARLAEISQARLAAGITRVQWSRATAGPEKPRAVFRSRTAAFVELAFPVNCSLQIANHLPNLGDLAFLLDDCR